MAASTKYIATALLVCGATLAASFAGCNDEQGSSAPAGFSQLGEQQGAQNEVFSSIARNLNEFENFENAGVLAHTRNLLNQWSQREKSEVTWKQDPLLESLPEGLKTLSIATSLDRQGYSLADSQFIETCVWLRDIARRVARQSKASQFDELAIAQALFDWTVRNIQRDDAAESRPIRFPGEILLSGRGSALERAWIFILLARQQQIDAVMLAERDDAGALNVWVPAVLVSGELYLLEPQLGLPIPAASGANLLRPQQGKPSDSIASIKQVLADQKRLRALDVDAEHPYPRKADDLRNLVALIEASPQYLARRMKRIEEKLTGEQQVVLTTDASALAEKLRKTAGIKGVSLWPLPFEVWRDREDPESPASHKATQQLALLQPSARVSLWKPRVMQLKGKFDAEGGAKQLYLAHRLSNQQLEQIRRYPQLLKGKDERLPGEPMVGDEKQVTLAELEARRAMLETAKSYTTYWLGLIAYEEGDYSSARNFFGKRTLDLDPNGPWTGGATYNLARTEEATGNVAKAIELYRGDTSAQSHGNQLRAKWLAESAGQTPSGDKAK